MLMFSGLQIIVLSENRVVNPKLIAEQGLSIFVETPRGNVLFDTGNRDAFLHNAMQLGIQIESVQKVFLSHGHYDHTGGLQYLAERKQPIEVICHPNLFNKKYRLIDGERIDIGVYWEKVELEKKGVHFTPKTHPKAVMPDIWVSGEIPRITRYETQDDTYEEQVLESPIHDELHDDMALILNTTRGLIVLMGCGHSGPVNTLKHAMRITGVKKIHVVMGGMHLQRAEDSKIEQIVRHLIRIQPDYIIPLHCTGFRAINRLFNLFGERVLLFNVGDSFTFNAEAAKGT